MSITGWLDVVADYGADPTGGFDSTSAINNAINALTALNAVLYFPPGTYKIGSGSPGQLNTLPSNVAVIGSGPATTTISSESNVPVFSANLATALSFEGFSIRFPNGPASGGVGFSLTGCAQIRITDVTVGESYCAIDLIASGDNGCSSLFATRVGTSNSASGSLGAFQSTGGSSPGVSGEFHFTDCVFGGASSLNSNAPANGWLLENTTTVYIYNCDSFGFINGILVNPGSASESVSGLLVSNSGFDENYDGSLALQSGGSSDLVYDCIFHSSFLTGSTHGGNMVTAGNRLVFGGNSIDNNYADGLLLENCSNIVVSGNDIFQNNSHPTGTKGGVYTSGASDVVAFGNVAYQGVSSVSELYALKIDEGSSAILVVGNDATNDSPSPALPIEVNSSVAPSCAVWNNLSFNPTGLATNPTLSNNTPLRNPFAQSATIYMHGVTTAKISNDNVTYYTVPGTAPSTVRLGPGQYIEVSYTGSPTFAWSLD